MSSRLTYLELKWGGWVVLGDFVGVGVLVHGVEHTGNDSWVGSKGSFLNTKTVRLKMSVLTAAVYKLLLLGLNALLSILFLKN
jgi:antibiotic biosynthesis monooxygenase (ABM) superfamily enzyme